MAVILYSGWRFMALVLSFRAEACAGPSTAPGMVKRFRMTVQGFLFWQESVLLR